MTSPRTMLAAFALLTALAIRPASSDSVAGATSAPLRAVTYPGRTMGSYFQIVLLTPDSVATQPLAELGRATFARLDSLMSNWTTTSEVARINREAKAGPTRAQPEVARVIAASVRTWRESDGAFDITVGPLVRAWGFIGGTPHVPTRAEVREANRHVGGTKLRFDPHSGVVRFLDPGVQIDLGGIAKGFAVDVVAESLRVHGVRDGLVNLTGNMFALGHPDSTRGWRIGIRDPRDRIPYFAHVEISNQGISTSGKYEQFVAANGRTYGHIMDPRTGRPAEGLISVTVVSPDAFTSDTWDTPLFVLGLDAARRKARAHPELGVILVAPGAGGVDTVWVESALRERFTLEPAAAEFFRVRTY